MMDGIVDGAVAPTKVIGGRYEVEGELGAGGFGITHRARDRGTGEHVAVKLLDLRRVDDWKAVELFEREARVLQTLDHPGIPKYVELRPLEAEREARRPFAPLSSLRQPRHSPDPSPCVTTSRSETVAEARASRQRRARRNGSVEIMPESCSTTWAPRRDSRPMPIGARKFAVGSSGGGGTVQMTSTTSSSSGSMPAKLAERRTASSGNSGFHASGSITTNASSGFSIACSQRNTEPGL